MTAPDTIFRFADRHARVAATLAAAMVLAAAGGRAHAQAAPAAPAPNVATMPGGQIACPQPPSGQPLIKVPELSATSGSVMALTEEFQRMPRSTGGGTSVQCNPQLVRVFRADGVPPPNATPPAANNVSDPVPGPTLRARVGDVVQLGFVNKVDSSRFDPSIDVDACMQVGPNGATYPGGVGDTPPNCLHASSTANLHFHGTHTSPNTTGDNVYLQIRPLPRNNQGVLTTTPDQAMTGLAPWFQTCATQLKDPLKAYPATWADMPKPWTDEQTKLLQAYQAKNPTQPLWDLDVPLKDRGWPQYYIGAVPYCFALPSKPAGEPVGEGAMRMGQAPGTQWYHAHKHGSTAINVENGMSGAFIIEGKYDDDLDVAYSGYVLANGKPWKTRDQPVLVLNQIGTTPKLLGGSGASAIDFVVNGRLAPVAPMQSAEVQLWRIVNSSGRNAVYLMAPPAGFHWRQLAQDGVQFANANYRNSQDRPIYIAPGNRVDLLVQAPTNTTQAPIVGTVQVQLAMGRSAVKLAGAAGITLMSVSVSTAMPTKNGAPTAMELLSNAPVPPKFLADITDAELEKSNYASKRLVFDSEPEAGGNGFKHSINGHQFTGGEAQVNVILGNTEEWTILNKTNAGSGPGIIDHPFHIHVNPFQITEVFDPNETFIPTGTTAPVARYVVAPATPTVAGQCQIDPNKPNSWKPCADTPQPPKANRVWWDTFAIPTGLQATLADGKTTVIVPGYFKMRSRFVDYAGFYVLHCHILVHEDRGMMFSVEVSKPPPMLVTHH